MELYKEESYARKKTTQICVRCGEPVQEAGNGSRLEHRISALCDACRELILYRCLHQSRELDPS